MTLTIYVREGYGDTEVITAREREQMIKEAAEEIFNSENYREEWINENYDATDFFDCEDAEKLTKMILENWLAECYDRAEDEFDNEWVEVVLDVDKEDLSED